MGRPVTRSTMTRKDVFPLPEDILVFIFSFMSMLDRLNLVAGVCKSWRRAASDRSLSSTIDLAECRSGLKPGTSKRKRKQQLELAFVRGVNLGRGNLTTLVIDPLFEFGDKHLRYASHRCPNLLNLVLPFPNYPTNGGLYRAFRLWANLESFHVSYPGFSYPVRFFTRLGLACPRLRELGVSCTAFEDKNIDTIINVMPNLRVLGVRCSLLLVDSPVDSLAGIPSLEEVYLRVSHVFTSEPMDLEAVNGKRGQRGFANFRAFHICRADNMEHCFLESTGCMASKMVNPPLDYDRRGIQLK